MPKRPAVAAGVLIGALVAITAALAAGHAAGTGRASAAAAPASVVGVVEHDFRISLSRTRLAPGPVVFRVTNRGPDAHELIVVRDRGDLPLRQDDMTIDEERLAKRILGALEPGAAGDVRDLRLVLRPGKYVLLCNMYGHYMGGMHSVVTVG